MSSWSFAKVRHSVLSFDVTACPSVRLLKLQHRYSRRKRNQFELRVTGGHFFVMLVTSLVINMKANSMKYAFAGMPKL